MTGTGRGAGADLDRAYALAGPADNARLYADWAATYDAGFAATAGYTYPAAIARLFVAEGGAGPVLDIGAGTGLVGAALPGLAVDALDIAPEMLAVARAQGRCRHALVADLTRPLPVADGTYAGITSAGTFTHGHVGPGCLPELLRIARPGARLVLGIHEGVFDGAGFGSALARLAATGALAPLRFARIPIYAPGATHAHAGDRALVALLAKP